MRRFRLTRTCPDVCQSEANKLAEHLADLRRGREISGSTQWIARAIIISVHLRHVVRERDRPSRRDGAHKALRKAKLAATESFRRHWPLPPREWPRQRGGARWRSGNGRQRSSADRKSTRLNSSHS